MNLSPLEQINNLVTENQTAKNSQSPEALRKAAMQFEAVLLMQLTSILNSTGSGDGDEDSLFGNDGGTDLAKKMFSEQLATTMSESGGIGLADNILQQFGINPNKISAPKNSNLSKPLAAMREIKQARFSQNPVSENNFRAENSAPPVINRSGKIVPVNTLEYAGNGEAEIISTFENEARSEGIEASQENLILDGKLVNTTRARIVPNVTATENTQRVSSDEITLVPINASVNYQLPVSGRISSNFGTRFHPVDKKIKFHGGMDIAAPKGTPIGATADGEVSFAGWKGGYGNVVIIQHADGRESRYGHADKLFVQAGDKVSAGQKIAAVGSTGKSTGPHLHFEIRENGELVNPKKILSNVLLNRADR